MNHDAYGYGLWGMVVLNSAIFLIFAFSFYHPRTKRDWRSFGAFSAFIVALFTEMYGFPLTIYLLSGWLQHRYPGVNIYSHDAGHLWATLFRLQGDPHFDAFHVLSMVFIFGGFILLSAAWRALYRAQRTHELAVTGPYAYIRHPQYAAFIMIMVGFLLQWPTIITLAMFPILAVVYVKLAHREELEVRTEFGNAYEQYAALTPGFIPRLNSVVHRTAH
jgi:methanethiol S-methyltransferase